MQIFFACGICLSAAIAVVFPSWRQMYLVAGTPTLLFIGSRWLMPESPKWLAAQLRQGKMRGNDKVVNSEAESADQHRTLLNISDTADDSAKLSVDAKRTTPTPGRQDLSYLSLLKDADTSSLLLLVCVPWLQSGFLYYGITLSAGSISKEIHLNMFLMGIVEIPGYLAAMYFADTFGRKKTFIGLTIVTAFFCLVSWSYPEKGGRLMFALVGKTFAAGGFSVVWVWCPEMFPTNARSLTTAIGSQAARVGSILAPYVVVIMSEMTDSEGNHTTAPLPQPVFAAVALVSCVVCLWLPETSDTEML